MLHSAFLTFLCLILINISTCDPGYQPCYIINKDPIKPSPTLIQCYRDNPQACCNSLADEYIMNKYNLLLSNSCQRSYPWLEAYFCLACDPSEPTSTDHSKKTVTICKSLLDSLWAGDLNSPTTVFDKCGFSTIWKNDTSGVVLPSSAFSDVYDFMDSVKPPFFEGFTIQVSMDNTNCYGGAGLTTISLITLIIFCLSIVVL